MNSNTVTLYQLNSSIKDSTRMAFPDYIWVMAEILEIHLNRSGHCYLELIEKSETDDRIIARSRATIWATKFRMLKPYFETTTGTMLQSGIKVLLKVEVSFHEIYGHSLNISDIDPAFTLGDLEMKKREIIKRLQTDGVINMNKDLPFPAVPQRVAVISAKSAAGYGDFMDSIDKNLSNLRFHLSFFPAAMQGEGAAASVISAFEEIFKREDEFDAVVLIRGGGSQADLDCFNNYELALNIAQFPIPVITGIGHERDETIADIVAHSSLKTPTAAAEFLLDKMLDFLSYVNQLQERFEQMVHFILQEASNNLQQKASDLNHLLKRYLTKEESYIKNVNQQIRFSLKNQIKHHNYQLEKFSERNHYLWKSIHSKHIENLEKLTARINKSTKDYIAWQNEKLINSGRSLELLKPEKVIERGYSITYVDGKNVNTISKVRKGDRLITLVKDGKIISTTDETIKKV